MRFVKIFLALVIFVPGISSKYLFAQKVPSKLTYCQMELTFTEGARNLIQEHVNKITASPRYFNEMVKRACTYLPFVEAAFNKMDVPQDLKYLVIQESSLRATAVSPSQAVGFWQFKEPTAREVGLRIDDLVDERMHIYRASEGAAIYLSKANYQFDNWVYALLAYREGPTGALAFIDKSNFSKSSMTITEDIHPYVVKAIAHKLVYEPAIRKNQLNFLELKQVPNNGTTQIPDLQAQHQVDETVFFTYNPWIKSRKKRLPKNFAFTYFIPASSLNPEPALSTSSASPEEEVPVAVVTENLPQTEPEPYYPSFPKAIHYATMNKSYFAVFAFKADLHYGIDFILYDGKTPLTVIASQRKKLYSELLVWNELTPGEEPEIGSVIYLKSLRKCDFHIVETGENIAGVASMHGMSIGKLQKLNNMEAEDIQLYIGQKVYLDSKKPKGERTIILVFPQSVQTQEVKSEPIISTKDDVPQKDKSSTTSLFDDREEKVVLGDPVNLEEAMETIPEMQTEWIEHTVSVGETLWSISQKYDT
ncbi:MAG: transglycosylase SLT domain-containing protein, partial [Bacteroidota bacterium]